MDSKSKSFDFWKMCWDYSAIDMDMLKEAVEVKELRDDEFKTITGEEYVPAKK